MRQLFIATALIALAAGCRETHGNSPDAGSGGTSDASVDAGGPGDAPADGPGATPDAAIGDGIAAARAAADGAGLALAIHGATVTYAKPQIGSPTNDPAGFTIQAVRPGPALFVAIDPATLTPAPAAGDVVDFTIAAKATVNGEPRATQITGWVRGATGADVAALAQDVSAATDVVSALDGYDAELVTITGTVGSFTAAGTGFTRAVIDTAGITGNANLQLRVPEPLTDAIDLVATCRVTATRVPMGRFFGAAQIGAFAASEVALTGCPAPAVIGATPVSTSAVKLTFSRRILPGSVLASGSQFTFDQGLTAMSATVSGRTVTIVTTAQAPATTYAVQIASTVTDLQGTAVAAPGSAMFVTPGSAGAGAALSVHTTLGIPSPTSTADPDRYLSVKSGYVVSYNSSRKVPNWVSWELNTSYLGTAQRQDDYRADDTLPPNLPQAQLSDYSGSGYDRGHMCPSADRTLTVPANSQTFYLSNMVPQAANNNQGPWNDLEIATRQIAQTGKELFVISGGTFSASSNAVGNGVVVPDQTFKVIVVLDAIGQGPADVTANTRVIAVLMPNENAEISKSADWHTFRVSVDAIEAMTGYDFLSDVDPAIQAIVEARVDNLP